MRNIVLDASEMRRPLSKHAKTRLTALLGPTTNATNLRNLACHNLHNDRVPRSFHQTQRCPLNGKQAYMVAGIGFPTPPGVHSNGSGGSASSPSGSVEGASTSATSSGSSGVRSKSMIMPSGFPDFRTGTYLHQGETEGQTEQVELRHKTCRILIEHTCR